MDNAERRRARARESYARGKTRQDHALLRLDRGDLARLDAACASLGLTRAGFARTMLVPLAEAAARGAAEDDPPSPAPLEVGAEFDALFGG